MARFLSERWARELEATLNADERFTNAARDVTVTVQQIVTDVPGGGETRYWTRIADGRIETGTGTTEDADVVVEQEYETAVALHTGRLNPQSALLAGMLKVRGNFPKLLLQHAVVDAVAPVLAGVPTEY